MACKEPVSLVLIPMHGGKWGNLSQYGVPAQHFGP